MYFLLVDFKENFEIRWGYQISISRVFLLGLPVAKVIGPEFDATVHCWRWGQNPSSQLEIIHFVWERKNSEAVALQYEYFD